MSLLPELRESLVRAAERAAADSQPPRLPPGRGRRVWSGVLRALPVVIAVGVAAVIAVVALGELGHHSKSAPATSTIPGRQQLIDILAPLRRHQTKEDLPPFLGELVQRAALPQLPPRGTPDVALVRYAATTPWGARVYLVPMKPPTARELAAFERRHPEVPRRLIARLGTRGETLDFASSGGGGGGINAADLKARGLGLIESAGRPRAGGSSEERLIQVVPDGVSKVEFVLPRQPNGNQPGSPTYAHTLVVTVPVHDNVAAVQVDRACCGSGPMIWYGPNGRVLKRIGTSVAANLNGTYTTRIESEFQSGALNGAWNLRLDSGAYTFNYTGKTSKKVIISGSYAITGRRITFKDRSTACSAKPGSGGCRWLGCRKPATYTFKQTGQQLVFAKVRDPNTDCELPVVLAGDFHRVR